MDNDAMVERVGWWMIERDDLNENNFLGGRRPMYFYWDLRPDPAAPQHRARGRHNWTADWQKGERFASKENAEAHTNNDPLLHVREHGFITRPTDSISEQVARAIHDALDLSESLKLDMAMTGEFSKAARIALEASHHAELVEALRQAVKTNPQEHWIELLTKIGEGQ